MRKLGLDLKLKKCGSLVRRELLDDHDFLVRRELERPSKEFRGNGSCWP
jgi:hypothetical protein